MVWISSTSWFLLVQNKISYIHCRFFTMTRLVQINHGIFLHVACSLQTVGLCQRKLVLTQTLLSFNGSLSFSKEPTSSSNRNSWFLTVIFPKHWWCNVSLDSTFYPPFPRFLWLVIIVSTISVWVFLQVAVGDGVLIVSTQKFWEILWFFGYSCIKNPGKWNIWRHVGKFSGYYS